MLLMSNSTTPASRAARLAATRRQEAKRKVTVWLPPDAVSRLDTLTRRYNGISAAIEAALSTKNIGVLK
jgi:hypothetical protein